MSAEEHDRTITVVSHLPQVVASALLSEAADEIGDLSLAGGGLRDLTRIAGSDAVMWSELLSTNRTLAAATLRRFANRLEAWAGLLDDPESVGELLGHAAGLHADLHAHVGAVDVALLDRPGELAAVGRALDQAGADVRDLQMRHAPHGGGGLLKIYIRDDELDQVRKALDAEGLSVTRIQQGGAR
jgi:prephenate dehydrogenase